MLHFLTITFTLVTLQLVFSDIFVDLPDGRIRGKESKTFNNKTFYSFLKIPFAAPPVGELRFKAPRPPKPWPGVLDATINTAICYQVEANEPGETEDCLYLNVYTPQLPYKGGNDTLSVMLWFHGGGFTLGTSLPSSYGPEFFIDYDVIIVTTNYRLGPFGFLSTGDTVIPGNNGLKDQQLAIKWTHDNIKLFGGDPTKITIFGESAGASSVSYQLLNKKKKRLFRGAICQSGSYLGPWSLQRNPRRVAFQIASLINSTFLFNKNAEELHQFLLSVPAHKLDSASFIMQLGVVGSIVTSQEFVFAPVIEPIHKEAFITQKQYGLLKSGNFIKVPTIIGINSEEVLFLISDAILAQIVALIFDTNENLLVPIDMNIKNQTKIQIVGKLIKQIYTNKTFTQEAAAVVRFLSDQYLTRSIIKHAELQSKFSKVYFYQFSYDGKLGGGSSNIKGLENGVRHAEELQYMWRTDRNTDIDSFPKPDVITHYRLLKLWTDFAKTLNPTPKKSTFVNVTWPSVDSRFLYLDIDKELKVKEHPKEESYRKWNKLYDEYAEGERDTY